MFEQGSPETHLRLLAAETDRALKRHAMFVATQERRTRTRTRRFRKDRTV